MHTSYELASPGRRTDELCPGAGWMAGRGSGVAGVTLHGSSSSSYFSVRLWIIYILRDRS